MGRLVPSLTSVCSGREQEEDTHKVYTQAEIEELYSFNYIIDNEPWDDLPLVYVPSRTRPKPPLFHYGIGFTYSGLADYATRKNLLPDSGTGSAYLTMLNTLEYLQNLTEIGEKLYYRNVESTKVAFVFALYSNFRSLVTEEERDHVADILEPELDGEFSWYYDAHNIA
ncbi:uncharacterized protein ARMOST_03279 [Armillaria ostoyae]|uniref:Uncharacterized protein n=2 Tax=Armillaria TaxID=47424 RepID=A0A284QU08_ARMOS|nr:hypothetical protein EV421DRAFT_1294805 [Armillaria borealis]SJK99968.1 uncharacterized protein ARMOST_03279 [Armillaria ostoyae]